MTDNNSEVPIPRPIRFWLLLLFVIPAVLCTLFILYHLLFTKKLRQALHNHVMILLLFIALFSHLIDIPSYITFLRLGYVWLAKPRFCSFWSFVAVGLFDMISMLMAWTAIERHILIFHRTWMNTRRKRFLFHYLPLILIIFYDILFYLFAIFFPPCENLYDYTQLWCGYPCYYDIKDLNLYDTVVNCLFPTILIIIFSIALIIRFIRQKRRVQQVIQWHRHRTMIIQLLSISLVPVIFNCPSLILSTAYYCGLSKQVGINAGLYLDFFSYFIPLLLPYVCLASLPELWKKVNIVLPI